MACGDDLKTQLSRYVDGELNAEEKAKVDGHVAECEACRDLLSLFQKNENLLASALSTDAFGDAVIESVVRKIGRKERIKPASLEKIAEDGVEPQGEFLGAVFKQTSTELEELREKILYIVNALPRIYQQIILLRHLRKMTYREMSDFLGLPIATIESRLYRARLMLKEKLMDLYL